MQQAARVSDETVFLTTDSDRAGYLVEHGSTRQLFTNPTDERTEAYITGRFRLRVSAFPPETQEPRRQDVSTNGSRQHPGGKHLGVAVSLKLATRAWE